MPRLAALAILLSATALAGRAQAASGSLNGRVDGEMYIAPTGSYKVAIPVQPEMGGIVTDTPNVVTFRDDYSILYSIAAFRMDSSERWKLSMRGTRGYLQGFFNEFVLPDFRHAFPNMEVQSNGLFMPKTLDGALVTYTLLPGGSMFADKLAVLDPARKPLTAKRGNMIFVKDGFVYVISTELAERVTEGSAYSLKPEEEDVLLREKLSDMIAKIRFLTPSPTP